MLESEFILLAETVDWYWWHVAKRRFIQVFLKKHKVRELLNKPRSSIMVLDAGCGVGSNYEILSKFGIVVGADSSKIALQYAKKKQYEALINSSLDAIPSQKKSYDLIGCFDVLYHQNISDEKVLRSFAKMSKKNSWLIITDCVHPWLWSEHDNQNLARERYRASELLQKVSNSGWEVVDWSYLFTSTFGMFVGSRILGKIFKSSKDNETAIAEWLNYFLVKLCYIESQVLKRMKLPFGSSVIILARKK